MALWCIEKHGDELNLVYFVSAIAGAAQPQHCGHGAVALERDLEAWVADQAAAFDIVVTTRGSFVRQAGAPVRA